MDEPKKHSKYFQRFSYSRPSSTASTPRSGSPAASADKLPQVVATDGIQQESLASTKATPRVASRSGGAEEAAHPIVTPGQVLPSSLQHTIPTPLQSASAELSKPVSLSGQKGDTTTTTTMITGATSSPFTAGSGITAANATGMVATTAPRHQHHQPSPQNLTQGPTVAKPSSGATASLSSAASSSISYGGKTKGNAIPTTTTTTITTAHPSSSNNAGRPPLEPTLLDRLLAIQKSSTLFSSQPTAAPSLQRAPVLPNTARASAPMSLSQNNPLLSGSPGRGPAGSGRPLTSSNSPSRGTGVSANMILANLMSKDRTKPSTNGQQQQQSGGGNGGTTAPSPPQFRMLGQIEKPIGPYIDSSKSDHFASSQTSNQQQQQQQQSLAPAYSGKKGKKRKVKHYNLDENAARGDIGGIGQDEELDFAALLSQHINEESGGGQETRGLGGSPTKTKKKKAKKKKNNPTQQGSYSQPQQQQAQDNPNPPYPYYGEEKPTEAARQVPHRTRQFDDPGALHVNGMPDGEDRSLPPPSFPSLHQQYQSEIRRPNTMPQQSSSQPPPRPPPPLPPPPLSQAQPPQSLQQSQNKSRVSNVVCRFYKSGSCGKGSLCPFSHNLKLEPCFFFFSRNGNCAKGDKCPYSHDSNGLAGDEIRR